MVKVSGGIVFYSCFCFVFQVGTTRVRNLTWVLGIIDTSAPGLHQRERLTVKWDHMDMFYTPNRYVRVCLAEGLGAWHRGSGQFKKKVS